MVEKRAALTLTGYRYSVYTWIVRMMLHERGLAFVMAEVDPFDIPAPPALAALTPFGKVPVLDDAGFVVFETAAILRYLEAAFPGPPLVPTDPRAAARMVQAIGIADHHGYWPMVRQVFSHRVFSAIDGRILDPAIITAGLAGARAPLQALDRIAAEGLVLGSGMFTLADVHLAPIIGCFAMAPEGAAMLADHRGLHSWWSRVSRRPSLIATAPPYSLPA